MFTGLVGAMGAIESTEPRDGGLRLWIDAGALAADPAVGDSVAVDGCCLTVVALEGARLAFDAIPETLRRTTLGRRGVGDAVNLELPLLPTDRLGGHFVQGHVDAVTDVTHRRSEGADVVMTMRTRSSGEISFSRSKERSTRNTSMPSIRGIMISKQMRL